MSFTTVQKLGDTFVVVLPPELQQEMQLAEGSKIEMHADQGKVRVSRRKYTLQELIDQCDPNAPVSDEDRAWDEMKPVGRELI
jgi:antitoxin ChpS